MGSFDRGLCTTFTALLLSSAVGSAIAKAPNRLRPLLWSISINRASVTIACSGWFILVRVPSESSTGVFSPLRISFFIFVVAVGMAEKLSAIANMITSEREWIPTLASGHEAGSLTTLNAVMRRIDLTCKILAPLVVAGTISLSSTATGALMIAGTSIASWGVEVLAAQYVWRCNPILHKPSTQELQQPSVTPSSGQPNPVHTIARSTRMQMENLQAYFGANVWVPSFALSLLHVSVLSYSATLITYLLNSGFSLPSITIARTLGGIIEVSSTYLAPVGVRSLGRVRDLDGYQRVAGVAQEDDLEYAPKEDNLIGLARTGLWGICLQTASLVGLFPC